LEADSYHFFLANIFHGIEFLPFSVAGVIGLIINICLLLSSALISGSEVAYFSLSPNDLSEIRNHPSKTNNLISKHLNDKESLLATILIGNNFVNVAIVILTSFVADSFIGFGNNELIKFAFEIIFITALILFFGEILPKIYSSQSPKKFASLMAYPLLVLSRLFRPLSAVLVKSTNIVNKRIKKNVGNLSLEDISQALELTSRDISEEKEMLEGIVKFGNIDVSEIMTARVDVVDVEINSDYKKVLQVIIDSGYSRIPVFEDTPDKVKGILYVKDLLPYLTKSTEFKWQRLIRDAYYVPETKMISDLLGEFQAQNIHMAIVVDEYGGTSGVVTLEDILEEIVGDINDEMDDEEQLYTQLEDGSFVFEGKTLINDFHKATNTDEDLFEKVRGEAETLAGILLELKGTIPAKHEIITFRNIDFTILASDSRRIKKVKCKIKPIGNE